MTKKRLSASKLVTEARANGNVTWHGRLSSADRQYVNEVVRELSKNPGCSMRHVATCLISELDLCISEQTVAKTLREMVNAASKSK